MRRRLLGSEESASAYEDPSEGVGAAKGGAQPSTLGVVGHQWCEHEMTFAVFQTVPLLMYESSKRPT